MTDANSNFTRLVERNTQLAREVRDHATLLTPDAEEQVYAMASAFTALVEQHFGPRRAFDVTMTILAPTLSEWDAARSESIQ